MEFGRIRTFILTRLDHYGNGRRCLRWETVLYGIFRGRRFYTHFVSILMLPFTTVCLMNLKGLMSGKCKEGYGPDWLCLYVYRRIFIDTTLYIRVLYIFKDPIHYQNIFILFFCLL